MKQRIVRGLRALPTSDRGPDTPPAPPRSDFDLDGIMRPPRALVDAAVLVPLVSRGSCLHLLLTRRAARLQHHPGQISFPGGRREARDVDLVATALRETREEIGISRRYVRPLGCLDDYETVTGYRVTPVVAFVAPGFALRRDPREVSDIFEVPLSFFLRADQPRTRSRVLRGVRRHFYVYLYRERYIWGATAAMIRNLVERIHAVA